MVAREYDDEWERKLQVESKENVTGGGCQVETETELEDFEAKTEGEEYMKVAFPMAILNETKWNAGWLRGLITKVEGKGRIFTGQRKKKTVRDT